MPSSAAHSSRTWLDPRILTFLQNRLLDASLSEYHSGFRAYSVAALARIPFGYNTNVFHFDTEILIQLMLAGCRIAEVPIGSELALLESNGADVVMMLEPAASIAASQGYRIVTSVPALWGPFAFTGLTSTRANLTQNPDVATDMHNLEWDCCCPTPNAKTEVTPGFTLPAPHFLTGTITWRPPNVYYPKQSIP